MNTVPLESIESAINQLSFLEQAQLLERIGQRIRRQTEQQQSIAEQLAPMAADPDIQSELRQIEAEFAGAEVFPGVPRETRSTEDFILPPASAGWEVEPYE